MDSIIDIIEQQIKYLQAGPTSREVSVAITQLQTGLLWLREAKRVNL